MSLEFAFSSEILRLRLEMGLTQEMAATALDISVRWYQHIESGRVLPGNELLLKIIMFFEMEGAKLKEKLNV